MTEARQFVVVQDAPNPAVRGTRGAVETPRFAASVAEGSEPAWPANVLPLSDQLRSAGTIQRALLPQAIPVLRDWAISGCCISAGPVGGDFYDIFTLPSGDTLLVVADVMGKGIPAALIASVTRTVIRMAVASVSGPGEAFARVNEMLYEDLSSADMFVTAQAAWLDDKRQELRISSAGHCPMLLRNAAGEVQSRCPGGIPIGVSPRVTYSEESISLDAMHCALMYTDGVTEARSPAGGLFGTDRLEHWLQREGSVFKTAESMKEGLLTHLEEFQSGVQPFDDQTVLVFSRHHM